MKDLFQIASPRDREQHGEDITGFVMINRKRCKVVSTDKGFDILNSDENATIQVNTMADVLREARSLTV